MDNQNRFYCEIERSNGLTILSTINGFILDPKEMLDIAQEIIHTVDNYSDAIEEFNIEHAAQVQDECSQYATKQRFSRVYLMKCGAHYKIGVTNNVDRRLKALDERPFKINLIAESQPIPNAYQIEKEIHSKYEKNRIRGEWFKLNEEEANFVSEWIRTLGLEAEDA
mgnify:CR=1 FL=1